MNVGPPTLQLQFCIEMHFLQIEFRSSFFAVAHLVGRRAHGTLLSCPIKQKNSTGGANRSATQGIN